MKGAPEVRRLLKSVAGLFASIADASDHPGFSLSPNHSATNMALMVSRQMFQRFLRHKNVQLRGWDDSVSPEEVPLRQIEEILDQFEWHFEAPVRKTKGSRPVLTPNHFADVFERSCQQQRNGTFYTPTDVTEYICANSILGHVLTLIDRTCVCHGEIPPLEAKLPIFENITSALQKIQPQIVRIADIATLEFIWDKLDSLRILDPTCGAGAFLVSALKLLCGLRTSLIEHGKQLVVCMDGNAHWQNEELKWLVTSKMENQEVLKVVLKQILERNLFGVDLLPEAAEVCRMRLLLELVALAEAKSVLAIEPSFAAHVQAGNAFVGYGEIVAFQNDRNMAFIKGRESFKDAIDRRYWEERVGTTSEWNSVEFAEWQESHRPFHFPWAFPEMIANGGFDIVVGNPPFVEVSELRDSYQLPKSRVAVTGNLYAVCMERASTVLARHGRLGMIVPMSSLSTPRMEPLMSHLEERFGEVSAAHFAVRPGKMFDGVDMNVSIILAAGKSNVDQPADFAATDYVRWSEKDRCQLFAKLNYHPSHFDKEGQTIPKTGSRESREILERLMQFCRLREVLDMKGHGMTLFYHSGGRYFRKCLREKLSKEYKPLHVKQEAADSVLCLLSSTIFYWYWITISDCYHVTRRDVHQMPFAWTMLSDGRFTELAERLLADMAKHAIYRERLRADGSRQGECNFRMACSRPILDEIDATLAEHYGLSAEHLQWILQYDQKYRSY